MNHSPSPTFQEVNCSPAEEAAIRLQKVLPPRRLPDHAVALLMQKQQFVTVRNCEIRFEFNGVPRVYTHVNSVTCQPANQGQKVLISYALDFPEAIFVLTDDGGYVETVPLKGVVKWFDGPATSAGLRDQKERIDRAKASLEQLHAGTATEKLDRMRSNADRVEKVLRPQVVNTFPIHPEGGRARNDVQRVGTGPHTLHDRIPPGAPPSCPADSDRESLLARQGTALPDPTAPRLPGASDATILGYSERFPVEEPSCPSRPNFEEQPTAGCDALVNAGQRARVAQARALELQQARRRQNAAGAARLSHIVKSDSNRPAGRKLGIAVLTAKMTGPDHNKEDNHNGSHCCPNAGDEAAPRRDRFR